jgi:hypothetical protein
MRRLIVLVVATGLALLAARGAAADTYDWSQALAFDVSASGQVDRTWNWSLQETASPAGTTLYLGDTLQQSFTLTAATTGSADQRWLVGGLISINPNPIVELLGFDGSVVYTTDPNYYDGNAYLLTPFGTESVFCPGGVPQMMTVFIQCSYRVQAPPQPDTGFVGVTAHGRILESDGLYHYYDSKSSSPPFSFATAPVTEHNGCVNISESAAGAVGSVCAGAAPRSWTLTRTVGPYQSCGTYSVASSSTLSSENGTLAQAAASDQIYATTRFAQFWKNNVLNASYSDLVGFLRQQLAAAPQLSTYDPGSVLVAVTAMRGIVTKWSSWNALPPPQRQALLAAKGIVDTYAASC